MNLAKQSNRQKAWLHEGGANPVLANTAKPNTARYYPEVIRLAQGVAGRFGQRDRLQERRMRFRAIHA
jgi:hypothetical protein